jgi:transcriptional regulator with PAS, ATPase and Fis domain
VRIGGSKQIPVDVRLIAATNQNLLNEIEKGNFRKDLYYRLNVVPFRLPPLRERPEDVIPVAEYHLSRIASRLGKQINGIHPEAKRALAAYAWPGNIREVRNAIEQAVNMTPGDTILLKHLPEYIHHREKKFVATDHHKPFNLNVLEKETIGSALRHYGGNITQASKALGIGRNTLYDKMKKYGVSLGER